jgi:hypothetical protein
MEEFTIIRTHQSQPQAQQKFSIAHMECSVSTKVNTAQTKPC